MVISESKLMFWHQMFFVDNRFETLSINFSNNLDIIGNNEIGRYDSTSLRFLPGFEIIIISAIFHASGTYFSRI
jgi:hypothetical protein